MGHLTSAHVCLSYLQGDGAWEPKAGALLALNKRVNAHLARAAAAAPPTHSRAAAQLASTARGASGAGGRNPTTHSNGNDRGEWLCSGSVSPSGASEDAAAVEEEGEMMEEGTAAVDEEQDAVMCDVWPNQDGMDGPALGHGYSTSQEVRNAFQGQ